ncbi:MAG: hypothetical protein KME19_03445 [Microcoleus vaginatus WJT46-NPBG5]|jgi:hypothetical protein|nr:hypothetical protein [Microcoleus vaginatus WJT46-NPBG5]
MPQKTVKPKTMFPGKVKVNRVWVGLVAMLTVLLLALSGSVFKSPAIASQPPSILAEVSPTDPSFAALQNLGERYGCYSLGNASFNGSEPVTKAEFVQTLSACLDSIAQFAK